MARTRLLLDRRSAAAECPVKGVRTSPSNFLLGALLLAVAGLTLAGCAGDPPQAESPVAASRPSPSASPTADEAESTLDSEEPTETESPTQAESPSADPETSAEVTPIVVPVSTDEGWSFEIRIDQLPIISAYKDVTQSPPGKARLGVSIDQDLVGEIVSLDSGRKPPPTGAFIDFAKPVKGEFPELKFASAGLASPRCQANRNTNSALYCSSIGELHSPDKPGVSTPGTTTTDVAEGRVDQWVAMMNGTPFTVIGIRFQFQDGNRRYNFCINPKTGKVSSQCLADQKA